MAGAKRHFASAVAVTVVIIVIAVGLGLIWAGYWRRGAGVLAIAAAVAGGARLVLPRAYAGALAVRSRAFDVLVFGAIAALFAAMALITVTRA